MPQKKLDRSAAVEFLKEEIWNGFLFSSLMSLIPFENTSQENKFVYRMLIAEKDVDIATRLTQKSIYGDALLSLKSAKLEDPLQYLNIRCCRDEKGSAFFELAFDAAYAWEDFRVNEKLLADSIVKSICQPKRVCSSVAKSDQCDSSFGSFPKRRPSLVGSRLSPSKKQLPPEDLSSSFLQIGPASLLRRDSSSRRSSSSGSMAGKSPPMRSPARVSFFLPEAGLSQSISPSLASQRSPQSGKSGDFTFDEALTKK